MTIKLVALDLDGTTLNNDRVISERNREAMRRAAEQGVNIVIATGRPLSALPPDVFEIEAIRYALTSNGARYAAKNLVAAGLADRCELQLAYAIGVARPVSIMVDSFGTGRLPDEKLAEIVQKHFDLRPAAIIRDLDLRRPIYRQVASYGHFGRTDLDLPWERLDKVEELKQELMR